MSRAKVFFLLSTIATFTFSFQCCSRQYADCHVKCINIQNYNYKVRKNWQNCRQENRLLVFLNFRVETGYKFRSIFIRLFQRLKSRNKDEPVLQSCQAAYHNDGLPITFTSAKAKNDSNAVRNESYSVNLDPFGCTSREEIFIACLIYEIFAHFVGTVCAFNLNCDNSKA